MDLSEFIVSSTIFGERILPCRGFIVLRFGPLAVHEIHGAISSEYPVHRSSSTPRVHQLDVNLGDMLGAGTQAATFCSHMREARHVAKTWIYLCVLAVSTSGVITRVPLYLPLSSIPLSLSPHLSFSCFRGWVSHK